ncbi:hypothetical protein [Shewanella japonica]|uniref:hypothetical protein n=1 Tax=Shewanella japonica TaxID=93973 RepID=UPI0024948BCB|nr:hypothetical protein [Shewanella japonica]
MRHCIFIIILIIITGCKSTEHVIPNDYEGNVAYIEDSISNAEYSMAGYFYIEKINGEDIYNAIDRSEQYSYANQLAKKGATRPIAINEQQTFSVVGEVYHSAPIGYLFNSGKNFSLKGDLSFTPEENQRYVVTGKLTESYSAVWIEDINGNIITSKLEKHGNDNDIIVETKLTQNTPFKKRTNIEHFKNLKIGESEESVIQKLGKPDDISYDKGNFFISRKPKYIYTYKNLGTIEFNTTGYSNNKAEFITTTHIAIQDPKYFASTKAKIMTAEAKELRTLARNYAKQTTVSNDILDVMADRIWKERNSNDSLTIDATSWLCNVLGNSRQARYKQHLQSVIKATSSKKLKKYAEKNIKLLTEAGSSYIVESNMLNNL